MKRNRLTNIALLAGLLALFSALVPGSLSLAADKPLAVFVSIPPEAYLAERVGGAHVVVSTLADKGQDPHTFEPVPQQIIALGNADLYFTADLPFEKRLVPKIVHSGRPAVVDISRSITKHMMDADHHEDGNEERHGHGEPDPHIWLSPQLLRVMAENIAAALTKVAPQYSGDFQENLAAFEKEAELTDVKIREALKPFAGQTFLVYHPAFGYFAAAYGLHQEAVEFEGKSPTPRHLAQLISAAKAQNVKIIFVQPQFDKTSARTISQAIGGAVIEIDSLAYDVLANLEAVAEKIKTSLSATSAAQ